MTRATIPGSHHEPRPDHQVLHRSHPDERVEVSVVLRRPREAAAIGTRLSPEAFELLHGADIVDWDHCYDFLTTPEFNLTVLDTHRSSRRLRVAGTVQKIEQAFGVQLHVHQAPDGTTYRAHRSPVTIPPHLDGVVTAVLGLDTRPVAKPHVRRHPNRGVTSHDQQAAGAFTPLQLADLYGFPSSTGAGQTIAILELGGGYNQKDLNAYFQSLGIGEPNVTSISVDHAANSPGSDADGEVMLDIEVAGAVAPAANIVVLFAPNTDAGFLDAINQAVHDTVHRPSILSISWGGPESSWTTSAMQAMDAALADACTLGVTVLVAAGDNGSGDGVDDGRPHADFPASSPHVTACGGTTLKASSFTMMQERSPSVTNGSAITSEVVWDTAQDGATGGGYSSVSKIPSYQQAGRPYGRQRGIPDCAANANPETGYIIRLNSASTVLGGTSAVAPLVAGLVARLNQLLGKSVGFLNPHLYAAPSVCRDITTGSSGVYSASKGWDPCSGLGVIVGTKLLAALQGQEKPA